MRSSRRQFLNAGAAIGAATVAACATPRQAGAGNGDVLFAQGPTTIPVLGSDKQFQVRRIYCVGRNYAAHAREMGSDPDARAAVLLPEAHGRDPDRRRPASTIDHPYPPLTKNYHYEVELVAALGKGGRNIPAEQALEHRVWLRRSAWT